MKRTTVALTFTIPYFIEDDGSYLEVVLYAGGDVLCPPSVLRLHRTEEGETLWTGVMELDRRDVRHMRYAYRVRNASGALLRTEPGLPHAYPFPKVPDSSLLVEDVWIDPTPEHVLSNPALRPFLPKKKGVYYTFKLPAFSKGHSLYALSEPFPYPGDLVVVGEHPLLGRWEPTFGLFLSPYESGGYYFRFPAEIEETDYKFVLISSDGKVLWENGANRHYRRKESGLTSYTHLAKPVFDGVREEKMPQMEGTAVPLFSLRTDRSFGAGDFSDAKDFVDWQSEVGQHVLQLLPIYDTRFTDSPRDTYPYNATTTIGIHPLYLDVRKLPFYDDAPRMTRDGWERRALVLNAGDKVDYPEVLSLKLDVARYSFRRYIRSSSGQLYKELETLFGDLYDTVLSELRGYAFFYSQKRQHPGCEVEVWPKYDPEHLKEDEEYYFSLFLQWQLYAQLKDLSSYARSKGVLLKGDLPIGVGLNSADAWMHPELFHVDMEAGSPPDAFSEDGQNWRFPTYDWDAMARDGYAWWRRRLVVMGRYFSLIRVDHILGFFRIYSIPRVGDGNLSGYYVPAFGYQEDEVSDILPFFSRDAEGLYHPHLYPEKEPLYASLPTGLKERLLYYRDEYFYRRNEDLWRSTSLERISGTLAVSPMVVCAEDLGVLPKSVPSVLRAFEILSLEVLRMPKKPGRLYVSPEDIPYLSVLTTSTHDTSTMREWWLDELDEAGRHDLSELYGCKVSTGSLIRALRRLDNLFLIFPLQDWFTLAHYNSAVPARDERINAPSDPDHVWDYRMYGFIKDLPVNL